MERRTRTTGQLIWILLFFAFAACVIASLLQGAMVYNNISSVLDEEFSVHTGLNYVQSRIRSGDLANGVSVGDFGGCSALFCREAEEDGEYITIIYCYDGAMRELYCETPSDFEPDAGEILLSMDELSFSDQGQGLILVTCRDGENQGSIYLTTRTQGGVAA